MSVASRQPRPSCCEAATDPRGASSIRRPALGNAQDDAVDHRAWFVGGFVKADNAQATDDVEIKWGLHPAGETRAGLNPDENATTLCLP